MSISRGNIPARILMASNYNALRRAYNVICYEMTRIVSEIDDTDVLAPEAIPLSKELNVVHKIASKGRHVAGLTRLSTVQKVEIDKDYELFFYICMSPENLVEIQRFGNWRSRSRKAVVFLLESWSNGLARDRAHLRLLDAFDHVFLFNRSSVTNVEKYTKTPCSFLPIGVDCLTATPFPDSPERIFDVYSMGRRSAAAHDQLFAMAERGDIFYMYDSLRAGEATVPNWHQHRFLTTSLIKRSRYFIAYNHTAGGLKQKEAGEEYALPTRLFEGAAGGAVMIGTAPRCPEFDENFDWPDAVIEIPPEPGDMRAILHDLDAQPERMASVRRTNAIRSLRRHDVAYRWEHILEKVGLEPRAQLDARKALLTRTANLAEETDFTAIPARTESR